jgi:hypothetical protein
MPIAMMYPGLDSGGAAVVEPPAPAGFWGPKPIEPAENRRACGDREDGHDPRAGGLARASPRRTGNGVAKSGRQDCVTGPVPDAADGLAGDVRAGRAAEITPQSLSTEEISRLWSAFCAHYRPTAAYMSSVVLIESRRSTRPSLPVQKRQLFVVPFREPRIEQAHSAEGPNEPILATSDLVILGHQLTYDPMEVRVDLGLAGIVERTDERLRVTSPAGLRAGVRSVQVEHLYDFGTPVEPHRGAESDVAAFVLRPEFGGLALAPTPAGSAPFSGEATLTITPAVGRDQRVVLLLNGTSPANPVAHSLRAEPRGSAADPIVVTLTDVQRGDYFVRVRVDGASGPLDLDPASPNFRSAVTI